MNKLVSKLQYEYHERGEFSDVAMRTLPETIALILNFPWQEQNLSLGVRLTSPSVTIEDKAGNFLRIGIYYNNQFCLYLLTRRGKYYVRITETLEDVFTLLTDFFDAKPIASFFRREYDFRLRRHFITKEFTYRITFMRCVWTMWFYGIAMLPLLLLMCPFFLGSDEGAWAFGISGMMFWFFISGINWLLFFNYLFFDWQSFITISKGHNKFIFGTKRNYREYDKADITDFVEYSVVNKRVPWSSFEVYEVTFKNGSKIRFTSLLLGFFSVEMKFNRQARTKSVTFPFVKYSRRNLDV